MAHNLEKYLQRLESVKKFPIGNPGTHLHMGCGPQILDGFVNIDGYYEDPRVTKLDMTDPMDQWRGTVTSVFSSHSLEHLPIRPGLKALRNWIGILKPGGHLFLAVPDLEGICRIFLDPNVSEEHKWSWYIYTLFGYQTDPNIRSNDMSLDVPLFPGQFHTAAFTMNRLRSLMAQHGMKIEELFDYDGWGTPSLYLHAIKPV